MDQRQAYGRGNLSTPSQHAGRLYRERSQLSTQLGPVAVPPAPRQHAALQTLPVPTVESNCPCVYLSRVGGFFMHIRAAYLANCLSRADGHVLCYQ